MVEPGMRDRFTLALERSTATQLDAITAPDRQLQIIAAAGSGKTRVLTLRLAYRCREEQLDPARALVATFSRRAADELRSRLFTYGVRDLTTGTIHGLALRLINEFRHDRGGKPAEVLTSRHALLRQVLGQLDRPAPGLTPQSLDAEIGWAKSRSIGPDGYSEAAAGAQRRSPAARSLVADTYAAFERLRLSAGVLDFDDLLSTATTLLNDDARFAAAIRWRYEHLSLDEAQDLNPAQRDLLLAIIGDDPDFTFVGDPNQSIYGWNGADPDLMGDLARRFPATRTIHLRANHRSSAGIVQVAGAALGAPGAGRSAKVGGIVPTVHYYPTDADEASDIAAFCLHEGRRRGSYAAVAVLARTNAQLQIVADALDRVGAPYRLAGGELAPASDLDQRSAKPRLDLPQVDDVVLSTFHKAKGLEWSSVVVMGVAEGLVPLHFATTQAELAEERRLLYVALTRATDHLRITFAERRVHNGQVDSRRRAPSRWLAEMEFDLQRQHDEAAPVLGAARLKILEEIRRQLPEA